MQFFTKLILFLSGHNVGWLKIVQKILGRNSSGIRNVFSDEVAGTCLIAISRTSRGAGHMFVFLTFIFSPWRHVALFRQSSLFILKALWGQVL